jgi:hypothetical protein
MGLISNPAPGVSSSTLKIILFLAFWACASLSGCKAPPIWSAESRSPDGKMIATADTFANGGFVAPGPDATLVYLNWTTGSQPKMLILAFSDGQSEPGDMKVQMNWLGPTHLELACKGQRTIDFQAVKYAGVDISVRELADATSNTSR